MRIYDSLNFLWNKKIFTKKNVAEEQCLPLQQQFQQHSRMTMRGTQSGETKSLAMEHARYIKVLTWLRGSQVQLGVFFFVSKSVFGIEGQKKLEKCAILAKKPRSHARIVTFCFHCKLR